MTCQLEKEAQGADEGAWDGAELFGGEVAPSKETHRTIGLSWGAADGQCGEGDRAQL